MKTLLMLISLDLKKGFKFCKLKFLVAFLALAALSLVCIFYFEGADSPSLGDTLIYLLTGITFYEPDPQRNIPFTIPNTWLVVFLFCSYITLEYPFEDLDGQGEISVLVCGSKAKWWLSKCIWVVLTTISYFIVLLLAAALATLITSGTLSLDVRPETLQGIKEFESNLIEAPWNTPLLLMSVIAVSCSINLIQLFASIAIKPLPAFGAIATLYILSAYFSNPLFPGEYLLAARSSVFVENGYSASLGLVLSFALGLWAVISSTLYFKQTDLMDRGES